MTTDEAQLFGKLEGLAMAAIVIDNTRCVSESHAATIASALASIQDSLLRRHLETRYPVPAGQTHNAIELRAF